MDFDDVPELSHQTFVLLGIGIRFGIENADSSERPSVGPTNGIYQIGYHVEPYVRIVSPRRMKERVRNQQLLILGNNRFTVEARAPKVLGISGMIRISFRAARNKDVYLVTQDPHDETCGYVERLRHEIHNLLPLFQNCVWNPRFRTMALRKQNFISPGRYFFHKPPCCRVSKKEPLIFAPPALAGRQL